MTVAGDFNKHSDKISRVTFWGLHDGNHLELYTELLFADMELIENNTILCILGRDNVKNNCTIWSTAPSAP